MNEPNMMIQVCALIGQRCPGGARRVQPGDRLFAELGFDSLSILETTVAIENEFSIDPIGHTEIFELVTVQDVVDLVARIIVGQE